MHQNKRTKDVSVVLRILSVSARVVRLGSSQQKVEYKGKGGNLTPTLHSSIFLASPEKIEIFNSFLVSSSTNFLRPTSYDLGADSALYEKLSNKKLDLFCGFFFFFFFLWVAHNSHPLSLFFFFDKLFCPFCFDAYDAQVWSAQRKRKKRRERIGETVKITREWRKKRENFMAYFLAFGLFCFHVALILIKTGENWKITNGRGARPVECPFLKLESFSKIGIKFETEKCLLTLNG